MLATSYIITYFLSVDLVTLRHTFKYFHYSSIAVCIYFGKNINMAETEESEILVRGLVEQLDNQEDCDVMFNVNGELLGAHKLIIKIRCKALHKMVLSWKIGDEPIEIDDMNFESFKAMLRYLYTGKVTIADDNVFFFLSLAVQFELGHLEQLCVDHISKRLDCNNIFDYMNQAVLFNSTLIKVKCQEMFSEYTHYLNFLYKSNLLALSKPALSAFLDVEIINMVEVDLFLWVEEWMKQQCTDQHRPVNGANMRRVIGDDLYKIRFPTMNVHDFANHVANIDGFLTESETAQIYKKITITDNRNIECPFPAKFRCRKFDEGLFKQMTPLLEENNIYDFNILFSKKVSVGTAFCYLRDDPYRLKIQSLTLVMQCCADIANSSRHSCFSIESQETRNQLVNDFDAWKDICKTKHLRNIMEKFMEIRTKLNQICKLD